MGRLERRGRDLRGGFERLRGPHMAGAGGHTEDEESAGVLFHPPYSRRVERRTPSPLEGG